MAGPLTHDAPIHPAASIAKRRPDTSASDSNAGWNGHAERFCGFEIDPEGKLAHLLDREMPGLVPRIHIGCLIAKAVHEVAGIGHRQFRATFGCKRANLSERVS
jgi:hypothetical protein